MQLQWQSPIGRTKTLLLSWKKNSASEKPWTLRLTDLPISFPLYSSDLFPWPFENLHIALHSCKHWNTILRWSHKPISAREMSDTLFVSCQQRGRGSTWLEDPLEDTDNLFPWHIWMDSNWHLSGWWGRMIKIQKNQEKTTKDKFFRQFSTRMHHTSGMFYILLETIVTVQNY